MAVSRKVVQGGIAIAVAAALAGGYSLFRVPLRVQWLVRKGAPPADAATSEVARKEIVALGRDARGALMSLAGDPSTSRGRKSWVCTVLLEDPFLAQPAVEGLVASSIASTARAATFAMMGGLDDSVSFRVAQGNAISGAPAQARRAEPWNPTPAVGVLIAWLEDRDDPEAKYGARLLGEVRPDDPSIPADLRRAARDALLKAVEEAPEMDPSQGAVRKPVFVDAIQSLLPWARKDAEVVARVSTVMIRMAENDRLDQDWDIAMYIVGLLEVSKGRGLNWSCIDLLLKSDNRLLRQRLANSMADIRHAKSIEVLRELVRDEHMLVRRAAVDSMKSRQDAELLEDAEYLAEDSYIYARADMLRAVGELRGVDPEGALARLPVLVEALEHPWASELPGDGPELAKMYDAGMAEVVEAATMSLRLLTKQHHGFTANEINFDYRSRASTAATIVSDPEVRKAVVNAWRETIADLDERQRIPALVRRLGDRDPASVLRAMRELHRLTGKKDSFPTGSLPVKGDDTDARNLIRLWMDSTNRETARETWAKRALPVLVDRLEGSNAALVVWAMRDLHRFTKSAEGFPKAALLRSPADRKARQAVRVWMRSEERTEALAHWRKLAGE